MGGRERVLLSFSCCSPCSHLQSLSRAPFASLHLRLAHRLLSIASSGVAAHRVSAIVQHTHKPQGTSVISWIIPTLAKSPCLLRRAIPIVSGPPSPIQLTAITEGTQQ